MPGAFAKSKLLAVTEQYYFAVSPGRAEFDEDHLRGVRLSSQEITAQFSDTPVTGRNYNSMTYKGVWKSDGVIEAEAVHQDNFERTQMDVGTWSVEEGKLCRQWEHWLGGRRECFIVTRERNTLRAYDVHGDAVEEIFLTNQE